MGKRSRKRMAAGEDSGGAPTTRAERDEARRKRAAAAKAAGGQKPALRGRPGSRGERPPAPWGTFPLVEIVVLVGIILIVAGAIVWGRQGQTMLIAGFVLASLAGLELSVREHFAGYKSHTTLLAGAPAVLVMTLTFVLSGGGRSAYWIALVAGVAVFGLCYWRLREAFKRRSGGLGFR